MFLRIIETLPSSATSESLFLAGNIVTGNIGKLAFIKFNNKMF